jgi:predicted MPP superfamily phosphohydrolase
MLFVFLIITEVLTFIVLYRHFFERSRKIHVTAIIFNVILSIPLWILFIEVVSYQGTFDAPEHIDAMLNLAGAICAITLPRTILIICHFTGAVIRYSEKGHIIWLTNTGLIISLLIFIIIVTGSLYGKFNFRTEKVTVKADGLKSSLDGLKIIHISDLHLSCFYRHRRLLDEQMKKLTAMAPDLIINTGDFVNYGWHEFDRFDTILIKARSRYGNYAVLGNHDTGIYHPGFDESEREENVSHLNESVTASGYHVLNDTCAIISIGSAKLALLGVKTYGRYPHISHGDLTRTMKGLQPADYSILLSHDPNHWEEEVKGKTRIDLTLAGHTHGMQIGILTKRFRWSPSKYFYPRWNGLYQSGSQFLYVNRGLGVLKFPFRIWMPPEITVITIKSAQDGN